MKRSKHTGLKALITAAVIVFGCLLIPFAEKEFIYPQRYSEYVEKYAAENGIDKYFIYAVIKTESGFRADALSNAGARGLMQIMEDSFDWVQFRMGPPKTAVYDDMYDPEENIRCGAYLLHLLLEEYGSEETAAAAYHTGRGNVNSWLQNSRYSSDGKTLADMPSAATKHYVKKIMTAYEGYKNLYEV